MDIAVIGSGISGLASAWLLQRKHRVVLYEAADYLGGHTNTVDVFLDGKVNPVDTGFLVHNDLTYPNLVQLFRHLGVETYDSEMSFSLQLPAQGLEWAGSSLATVFGQKRNLVRFAFLRMVMDLLRFNARARAHLEEANRYRLTLGELIRKSGYSDELRNWYLLPMAAAIWSCPASEILRFPAATFINFCINHRLLQVEGRPQWRTVAGGGRSYVARMAADLDVRLKTPVRRILRDTTGVQISTDKGTYRHQAVVLATHAPDSLSLLADASDQESAALGPVAYQANTAVLHTDKRFLPNRKGLWSAWNYLDTGACEDSVCVTYLLNRLQQLPFKTPLMVTLNPPPDLQPQGEISRFHYKHPVFDQAAIDAQALLKDVQGKRRTWFAGAWTGYGFHEDGLKSALRVALDLGVEAPWKAVI